jgi:hypothetical protein
MPTKKILVPVVDALSSKEIERDCFWLARYQPAQLYIVEILPPVNFFKWLFTPVANLLKKWRGSQAQKAQHHAMAQETFPCQVGEREAPNLVLGIVEAARREQPDMIVILPEMDESLGQTGINDLQNRLSEIREYVLIKPRRGGSVRIEPHQKKTLPDCKKVVPINRHTWVA